MRRLIYIPVIHSEEDMGSMSGPLKQEFVRQFGMDKWREHVRAVDNMWIGIKKRVDTLNLDYKKVKVYQDGLPLCGKEMEIVQDVARLGSHNYRIILGLVKKGAEIIGTEEPRLLIEEYNLIKKLTGMSIKERKAMIKKTKTRRDELIIERDKFVANRIKETLRPDEIGILFSGIEHEIDRCLPQDIKIEYIIYRLPFRKIQCNRN